MQQLDRDRPIASRCSRDSACQPDVLLPRGQSDVGVEAPGTTSGSTVNLRDVCTTRAGGQIPGYTVIRDLQAEL